MASATSSIDAPTPDSPYSYQVDVPPRMWIVPGWAMVVGTCIGAVRGSRAAGLRFLAENAHRPPRTVQGWYFYNKTKNYRMMLAGAKEGGSLAGKLGFTALGWVTFEELMERAGYGEVKEIGAGLGTAGLVTGIYRLPLRTGYQAVAVGLVAGMTMSALRYGGERLSAVSSEAKAARAKSGGTEEGGTGSDDAREGQDGK